MPPPRAAVSTYPSWIFHVASSPWLFSHFDKSFPSKSTSASDGAGAFWLNVAPGVTTRGWGRSGSCKRHLPPGSIGVSLKPSIFSASLVAPSTANAGEAALRASRRAEKFLMRYDSVIDSVVHVDGFFQADVGGATTGEQFDFSWFQNERVPVRIPICQRFCAQRNFDCLRFAGLQRDALESAQFLNGARDRRVQMFDVELNDFVARAPAAVLDRKS